MAQKIDDLLDAEHGVQSRAIGYAVGRDVADRVEHQIRAAKLQKSAMSHVIVRRPGQKIDRSVLSDEGLQRLAALVPIDEKDDARAQKRQESVELIARVGGETTGHQIKNVFLADAPSLPFGKHAPFDVPSLE